MVNEQVTIVVRTTLPRPLRAVCQAVSFRQLGGDEPLHRADVFQHHRRLPSAYLVVIKALTEEQRSGRVVPPNNPTDAMDILEIINSMSNRSSAVICLMHPAVHNRLPSKTSHTRSPASLLDRGGQAAVVEPRSARVLGQLHRCGSDRQWLTVATMTVGPPNWPPAPNFRLRLAPQGKSRRSGQNRASFRAPCDH